MNGDGAPGSFTIKSLTHYLSQAFGAGVHPSFRGSVTRLYPFNMLSQVEGHTIHNNYESLNGGCGGNGPLRVATGRVISVGDNSFRVQL